MHCHSEPTFPALKGGGKAATRRPRKLVHLLLFGNARANIASFGVALRFRTRGNRKSYRNASGKDLHVSDVLFLGIAQQDAVKRKTLGSIPPRVSRTPLKMFPE